MRGYAGDRFQRKEPSLREDSDGRYVSVREPREHQNLLLPAVKVSVCRACNNGWMSRLEIEAQDILDPMFRGEEVDLSVQQQATLAAWVSKSLYAYTSEWAQENRPWSFEEYRDLAVRREPSPHAYIWMGRSTADTAQVGMQVVPIYTASLDTPPDQVATIPPGGANGYLAAHSVVFIGHWLPEPAVADGFWEEFFDNVRAGLTRIWPRPEPIGWPMPDIPKNRLTRQREYLPTMVDAAGFHLLGRTAEEVAQIMADARSGLSPEDLNRKWGVGQAGQPPNN